MQERQLKTIGQDVQAETYKERDKTPSLEKSKQHSKLKCLLNTTHMQQLLLLPTPTSPEN